MWNSCVYVLPESLLLPISASRHARIVQELQAVTHNQCCSWLCAPQLYCTDCCHSACASCYCSSCLVPPSLGASFGKSDELDKTEQVKQVDRRDADVRTSDPELPSSSSSSSSLSHDETRASTSPSVKIRSKQQRPPWRYWRRTGPEPQHRQPGENQTHTELISSEEVQKKTGNKKKPCEKIDHR